MSEELWSNYTTRSDESADIVLLENGVSCPRKKAEACELRLPAFYSAAITRSASCPTPLLKRYAIAEKKQDSNYQIDAQKICGPLNRQIEQAMTFLRRNQTVSAVKVPHRVEMKQFSERAVFEAIVNAAAHRDYSIFASKIRFFMFDDRLEIYSPGALPNTVTIESIALRQATRNELITSLLAETPVAGTVGKVGRGFYMEKRGDGVPIILSESKKLSGKKPIYNLIDDSELLLTIYSATTQISAEN